jgi:VanZ family protein
MRIRFFEYQLPVVLWLLSIFFFSTDLFSANQTGRIIIPILMFLFPTISYEQTDFWHLVIRKSGHVTEYAVLATLAYRCFKSEHISLSDTRVRTILFVVVAALMDEWHQLFTAFRGASIMDVGYDCLGGVWALGLIGVYETWRIRSHSIL